MAKNTGKKIAIGAGIAAIVGYLAGILTAPKSGKETRGDIKHAAEKGISEAEAQLKKLHSELDKLVDKAKAVGDDLGGKGKKELDSLVSGAEVAKDKASGILSAVRKDKAADKDLQKAVSDATEAIEHLRKYLSK